MQRVVLIGIDGMDSEVVKRLWHDLPVLRGLSKNSPDVHLMSTFPPDTTPAWASIHTGLNPAEHGVINFVNIADQRDGYKPPTIGDDLFRGKTYWDAASDAGRRVCIVLPMHIYPGWKVNGILVARPRKDANLLMSHPPRIAEDYHPDSRILKLPEGLSSPRQLSQYLATARRRMEEEFRLAKSLYQRERWDLFSFYLSDVDGVQHYFWPYWDRGHARHPGPNEYESVIPGFYHLVDELIGEFLELIDDETAVILFSDHGHGPRPTRLANLNEWLRGNGLLFAKANKTRNARRTLKRLVRGSAMWSARNFGVGQYAMKVSTRFPVWKSIFAPASGIDWNRTVAYVSDLSAVKNYSYGGIRFNYPAGIENTNRLAECLLALLGELRIPDTGEPVVRWADRRENLYKGPFVDRFPEILVELDERYGLGWDLGRDVFGEGGHMYHLKPGTHRRHTPVLFTRRIPVECLSECMTLMDIAPLTCRLLEVPTPSH